MPGDKVTFKNNGDYVFGDPLQEMDVHRESSGTGAPVPESEVPTIQAAPTAPKKFDVGRLRRTAASSRKKAAVESNPAPEAPAPAPAEEPKPRARRTTKVPRAPKATKAKEAVEEKQPEVTTTEPASVPVTVVEEAAPPVDTGAVKGLDLQRIGLKDEGNPDAGQPAQAPTVPVVEEQPVVSESTPEVAPDSVPAAEPPAPTVESEPVPAPASESVVEAEAAPEPRPEPEPALAPEPEVRTEPTRVSKLNLSSLTGQRTTPASSPEPTHAAALASEQTTVEPTAPMQTQQGSDSSPFIHETLASFLSVTGLDIKQLMEFSKGVSQARAKGDAIWQSKQFELLRAYSCIVPKWKRAPAGVRHLITFGWGDHLTSCYIASDYSISDGSDLLECAGTCAIVRGIPVALSSERRRAAVIL